MADGTSACLQVSQPACDYRLFYWELSHRKPTVDNLSYFQMLLLPSRGRLVTDDWLRVLGAPSVFALGDCSVIEDKPLPQTAQARCMLGAHTIHANKAGLLLFSLAATGPRTTSALLTGRCLMLLSKQKSSTTPQQH